MASFYMYHKVYIDSDEKTTEKILQECFKKDDKGNYLFDFERIFPYPETIDDCPEDYIVRDDLNIKRLTYAPDSAINILKSKPWFEVFKYNNDYWGVPENVEETLILDDEGHSGLRFAFIVSGERTPYPIIYEIGRKYNVPITCFYCYERLSSGIAGFYGLDEDGGDFDMKHSGAIMGGITEAYCYADENFEPSDEYFQRIFGCSFSEFAEELYQENIECGYTTYN